MEISLADLTHLSLPAQLSLLAEAIASNEDLLRELLLRVPAESLVRFTCVSKNWLALISDKSFAFNHTSRNFNFSVSGLYVTFYGYIDLLPLNSHKPSLPKIDFLENNNFSIADSCNGLVLVNYSSNSPFIVCNPATRKYKILPEHEIHCTSDKFGAYLAFDPRRSPEYKVVLIQYHDLSKVFLGPCCQFDVLSSGSMEWKTFFESASPGKSFSHMAYWNGAIHWMSTDGVHFWFDLDEEKLSMIEMPIELRIVHVEDHVLYFGESGGSLFLVQANLTFQGLQILEFDGDDYKWSIKYDIKQTPFIPSFRSFWKTKCLRILRDEKGDNDILLVVSRNRVTYLYNPVADHVEKLHEVHEYEINEYLSHVCRIFVFPFTESLAPV